MMVVPFEKFQASFIDRLIGLGKCWLVSQTYRLPAGQVDESNPKITLLLSSYEDISRAKTHWNAVKPDKYAAVIHLEKQEHRRKLIEMLSPSSTYQLYWAVIKSKTELEHFVNSKYKEAMRKYIDKHTTWRIGKDVTIKPNIELVFGEVYCTLKYGSQQLRGRLDEIIGVR